MKRVTYNTRVNPDLIREFKILAIRRGVRQSILLEEALEDILKKHESNKPAKKPKS